MFTMLSSRRKLSALVVLSVLSVVLHTSYTGSQEEHLRTVWNEVDITVRNADGSIVHHEHTLNFRTNAGGDAQASQMGNTATQAAACNWIATTSTAITPAATDTTLSGEITTTGLARAQGVFTSNSNGSHNQFTVENTFTATGALSSVQAGGVFNASSSGSLCFEATWSPVNLTNTQTLDIKWTVNY